MARAQLLFILVLAGGVAVPPPASAAPQTCLLNVETDLGFWSSWTTYDPNTAVWTVTGSTVSVSTVTDTLSSYPSGNVLRIEWNGNLVAQLNYQSLLPLQRVYTACPFATGLLCQLVTGDVWGYAEAPLVHQLVRHAFIVARVTPWYEELDNETSLQQIPGRGASSYQNGFSPPGFDFRVLTRLSTDDDGWKHEEVWGDHLYC